MDAFPYQNKSIIRNSLSRRHNNYFDVTFCGIESSSGRISYNIPIISVLLCAMITMSSSLVLIQTKNIYSIFVGCIKYL